MSGVHAARGGHLSHDLRLCSIIVADDGSNMRSVLCSHLRCLRVFPKLTSSRQAQMWLVP